MNADHANDGPRFRMRVCVHDETEFIARDLAGRILLEVSADQGKVRGTAEMNCYVDEIFVGTTSPDDTEFFIDGCQVEIKGAVKGRFTIMKIAIADYRE